MGEDAHSALAAEAAVSLPAVTVTAHSVPPARTAASSRRSRPEGKSFCFMCLTSGTTYAGAGGNMYGRGLFLRPGPPGGAGAVLPPVLGPQIDTVAEGQGDIPGAVLDVVAAEVGAAAAGEVVDLGI